MEFATGKIWWIQDCSWSVRFYCGTNTWVLPRAGGFPRYLGYRSGRQPRSVTPWELYKEQWGPEPGGTKLKAQSRDQESGKRLLWTVALPERATVGEGTKPKIKKLTKALWVELNNQVIIQILLFLCCCLQTRRKRTREVANGDGQSL